MKGKWKQARKKILAVLLMLCMVLQMPYTGFGVEAEDATATETQTSESEYTEVTFSSYGIDNATYTGTSKSGSAKNLASMDNSMDKVAFSGKIKFSGNESSDYTYVRVGGINADRAGYALGIAYNNNAVYLVNHLEGLNPLKQVNASSLTKNPLEEAVEIRLTFDYEGEEDMRVRFSIEGTEYYNGVIAGGRALIGTYLKVASNTMPLTVTSTDLTADYNTLTFTDFGFDETTTFTNTTIQKSIADKTLNKVAIEGYYKFVPGAAKQAVYFGGFKAGIRLEPNANSNLQASYYKNAAIVGSTRTTIKKADTGFDLTNTNVKIKIGFEFQNVNEGETSGDIRVTILIEDQFQREFTVEDVDLSCFNRTITVWAPTTTHPLIITSIVRPPMEGYTVKTFTDFGFEEETTVSMAGKKISKSIAGSTLHKVAIEGYYNFYAHNTAQFVYMGADEYGLRIESAANGNMIARYRQSSGTMTELVTFTPTDLGITLTGTDVKIKTGFEFFNVDDTTNTGDVKVTMLFKDTIKREFTITGADLSLFNQTITVKTLIAQPLTVKAIVGAPEAMVNENHVEITQADFSFNGTQGAVKRSDIIGELGSIRSELTKGLAGTKLNMDILFPTSSDAKFCYGASTVAEDGLTIYSDGSSNLVIYDNINQESYAIDAQKAEAILVGERINLQISHVPDGNGGILLGVWINGTLYDDTYMELPNIARLGTCIATIGTEEAQITLWMPDECKVAKTDLTAITLSDFGIADNQKTTNSTGGVYKNGSNVLDTVFTMNTKLYYTSSGGNVLSYAAPSSGSWYGLQFQTTGADKIQLQLLCSGKGTISIATLKSEVAGVDLVGNDILMQISLQAADFDGDGTQDDLLVGVFFDKKLYNNRYFFVSKDGENIPSDWLKRSITLASSNAGKIEYKSVADWSQEVYLPTIMADYGIKDGAYTDVVNGTLDNTYSTGLTMNGKRLSAEVTFAESGVVTFGGKDGDGGVQIYREGENLYFESVESGILEKTELKLDASWINSLDTDRIDLDVSVEYVDHDATGDKDDVKIGLWMQDVLCNDTYFYVDNYAEELGSEVSVQNVTIASEKREVPKSYDYTQYTFDDYVGLDYMAYSANATGTITDMVSDEMIFTDKAVILEGGSITISGFELGIGDGKLSVLAGDKTLIQKDVAEEVTFAFAVKRVDADEDGARDDVRLLVSVDGEVIDNRHFYLLDYASAVDSSCDVTVGEDGIILKELYEKAAMPICLDTEEGYVLPTDVTSIVVNREDATDEDVLDKAGDYRITYTDDSGDETTHVVSCYYAGDVNVDNTIDAKDLVVLKKAEKEKKELTNAGELSVDFNHDGTISQTDGTYMRELLVGKKTVAEIKAENPETVFGVISDTHFDMENAGGHREDNFRKALELYRENGAKLIIVNADIADHGYQKDYAIFMKVFQEVYPDETYAPKVIVTADNHEYYKAWSSVNTATFDVVRELFDTELRTPLSENHTDIETSEAGLNSCTTVDGYYFIGISSDEATATDASAYSTETVQFLQEKLAEAAQADSNKPIFVAVHQPPTGTIQGGSIDQLVTEGVFNDYPQVVLFTSHTHHSIRRETSIRQENFTVINTGSLYYVGTGGFKYTDSAIGDHTIYDYGEGLLVKVNNNAVTIERYDFFNSERIEGDWVIKEPANKASFVYTDARKTSVAEPYFENDIVCVQQMSDTSVVLRFQAATHEDFVHHYIVNVTNLNTEETVATKTYRNDYFLGISNMQTEKELIVSGLEAGVNYKFEIIAVEAFGTQSTTPLVQTYSYE